MCSFIWLNHFRELDSLINFELGEVENEGRILEVLKIIEKLVIIQKVIE